MQALLEATQGSCGVTEQACQIVLIGVSGFVQRNQGIGFGGAILPGVVRVDDAMDKNDALVPFGLEDRKSTRLNSSHGYISYAVFCLKKKKKIIIDPYMSQSLRY